MEPNTQNTPNQPELLNDDVDTNNQHLVEVPSEVIGDTTIGNNQFANLNNSASNIDDSSENNLQDVHDVMRRKIIKITIGLLLVSALGLGMIFLISRLSDNSFSNLELDENNLATYNVPSDWAESTEEKGVSYTNGDSSYLSQANLVVITPIKVNFNSELLTDDEALNVLRQYEEAIELADLGLDISNRRQLEVEGFNLAFDYDINGVSSDGDTKIIGLSRVLFDMDNYLHTVEFIAVENYWNSNRDNIVNLVNSYQLK